MILFRLEDIERYSFAEPLIDAVLDFAKTYDAVSFVPGRRELDGQRAFMNFAAYETHGADDALMEAHKKYIDVMVMIDGEESVYIKNTSKLESVTKEYDENIDALLAKLDSDASKIHLTPGDVLVLYPEDAHAPGCNFDKESSVKKIIGKVCVKESV